MVSVVIPAYNEEQALPHTLRELLRQCGDYEVIVVDGDSTDRTRAILAESEFLAPSPLTPHSLRRLLSAPKGRASQMNAGAKEATGDWLLFLHADTVLPASAIQRLNEMEADHSIQAGGFMHQFSGDDSNRSLNVSTIWSVSARYSCARRRNVSASIRSSAIARSSIRRPNP